MSGEFGTERSTILCGLALKSLIVLVALGFGKSADVMCIVIVPHFHQLVCMYKVPIDRA